MLYTPLLPGAAAGTLEPRHVVVPLREELEWADILLGRVTGADPASMVADLKDGIYAVGFGGGQVDITNGKFVFSCTEACSVKNGVVGDPIRGATLIGDGATALQQIRAIGNDMMLDPGIGNCGKQGQWVPVGVGQPTLLIGGLTVGGSAA